MDNFLKRNNLITRTDLISLLNVKPLLCKCMKKNFEKKIKTK